MMEASYMSTRFVMENGKQVRVRTSHIWVATSPSAVDAGRARIAREPVN